MDIIYEPQGRAKEYADLAINIYKGCTHACKYCFGAKTPYILPEKYYEAANPKENIIARLRKDAAKLSRKNDVPEILLSFLGDVYQPIEMELTLTRKAIEVLIEYGLPFTILTKGGSNAIRDFDLLEGYSKARFGTTLIFTSQEDANKWEPKAPTIEDRIKAIEEAHKRGIPTWVSIEPVIDPDQALEIISGLHPIVNHWKIGKLNYHREVEARVDWIRFREEARALLDSLGADYYLKKSLTEL